MKLVLVYSGGLDSTTLLYWLRASGDEIHAISFDYGQRHRRELLAALAITTQLGIEHRIVNLSAIGRELLRGSSQTDDSVAVPHGHYAEETMKLTVVPGRNLIMASIALGWAASLKVDGIALGIHAGDHAIYPDCRVEWHAALEQIARINDWHSLSVEAPFLDKSKIDIAKLALKLGVPIEQTWTCYEGGMEPCGKCGSCVERNEALDMARRSICGG